MSPLIGVALLLALSSSAGALPRKGGPAIIDAAWDGTSTLYLVFDEGVTPASSTPADFAFTDTSVIAAALSGNDGDALISVSAFVEAVPDGTDSVYIKWIEALATATGMLSNEATPISIRRGPVIVSAVLTTNLNDDPADDQLVVTLTETSSNVDSTDFTFSMALSDTALNVTGGPLTYALSNFRFASRPDSAVQLLPYITTITFQNGTDVENAAGDIATSRIPHRITNGEGAYILDVAYDSLSTAGEGDDTLYIVYNMPVRADTINQSSVQTIDAADYTITGTLDLTGSNPGLSYPIDAAWMPWVVRFTNPRTPAATGDAIGHSAASVMQNDMWDSNTETAMHPVSIGPIIIAAYFKDNLPGRQDSVVVYFSQHVTASTVTNGAFLIRGFTPNGTAGSTWFGTGYRFARHITDGSWSEGATIAINTGAAIPIEGSASGEVATSGVFHPVRDHNAPRTTDAIQIRADLVQKLSWFGDSTVVRIAWKQLTDYESGRYYRVFTRIGTPVTDSYVRATWSGGIPISDPTPGPDDPVVAYVNISPESLASNDEVFERGESVYVGVVSADWTGNFGTIGPSGQYGSLQIATPFLCGHFDSLGPPSHLSASADSCWGIRLDWDPMPTADSFYVRRGAGVWYTGENSFRDTGAPFGSSQYEVAGMNEEGMGDVGTVAGFRPSAPLAPSSLQATDSLCSAVRITWSSSESTTSYAVFRDALPLVVVPSPALSYEDTTATGVHRYTIRAGNACGWSDSLGATGRALMFPPLAPGSMTASDTSSRFVQLQWSETPGAARYALYRGGILLASLPVETHSYQDTASEGLYTYGVAASNACGTSEQALAKGLVLPAVAWGDRFLDASDREGLPGTDVLVPIVGKRQEPIRGYSTVLRFDKDVFEVGSPPFDTAGTVSSGARMIVAGATDSTVRLGVVYSFTCPPEIPAGEADLIRVRLHVLDEAPPGLTYVGLQDIPPALNRMTACDGASLTPGLFGGVVRISNDAFIRGDVNGNGRVSVADPILNLSYQIQGGVLPCEDAADVDDDGEVNISDPIYSLFNIFDLGPRTPSPFPECGADPTLDLVRCQCHPACMVCGPTLDVAGGDSSTASVVLALAPERRIDEKTVAIPVYLSNETPLWGFEYTVEYPADEYSFLAVGGNVFEYCSGKDDPAAGRVRVGNVIRFDLAEALAPGIHGVGEVRFSARTPSGEKLPRLVEGFFAAEGGAEGTIEIGAITDVASAADSLPNTIRAMATPNPLNPSTTIRYAVPRSGPVTVEIFSAEGRVVRTLVAESQERGFHEAVWSGENNSGSRAGSGVYFYRIRASGLQETKKLVLLR